MAEEFRKNEVRGWLHSGQGPDAVVLAHGASSDSRSKLIEAVSAELCRLGLTVLRIDLPFRQARPAGPPRPGDAARDRQGLRAAVGAMRERVPGRVFLGGHSYGGRQATMLAAEDPSVTAGLLLLSYPLHPPGKPEQLRTAHLAQITNPAVFVHGSRDAFGSPGEMESALRLIPATSKLIIIDKAGHDLKQGRDTSFCQTFLAFMQ